MTRRPDSYPAPTERRILESNGNGLALSVPPELVEALAGRVADLIAERTPDRPEAYLNVEQAAEYLAAPVSRIYDLVRADRTNRLISHKDGKRLLFRREDLDRCLTRSDDGEL
jgi:excisionase family DNA binding protein